MCAAERCTCTNGYCGLTAGLMGLVEYRRHIRLERPSQLEVGWRLVGWNGRLPGCIRTSPGAQGGHWEWRQC